MREPAVECIERTIRRIKADPFRAAAFGAKQPFACFSLRAEDDIYGVENLPAIGRCDCPKDFALASASALEQAHQCSLRDRVEVEIEPHYRSRRIRGDRKRLLRNRKYRKDVTVRMIVRRWTRTAVTRLSEVRPRLKSFRWEFASLRIACIERQFGRSDRDVHDQPVPKAAAGRSVGVIAGYGEAFRSAWRARPRQMRRLIASRATEAEIFREYVSFGQVVAVAKALAAEFKGHRVNPRMVRASGVKLFSHDLVAEDNLRHLVPSGTGFKDINQANRTAGLVQCLTDQHA